MTKIQVRKQFTTIHFTIVWVDCCFQYDEDTSSKAIHNNHVIVVLLSVLFSIWRRYKFESNSQPPQLFLYQANCCFQYDEDTSSKAIHNMEAADQKKVGVVFNMTKIQVRKQFTTQLCTLFGFSCCFQYDEDTSSKAIHNRSKRCPSQYLLFSIWRRYKFESNSQLKTAATTPFDRCFQYDEDTSSKAIHNRINPQNKLSCKHTKRQTPC